MSPSRIVSHIQLASLNVRGEARERPFPHRDALPSSSDGPLHSLRLFAASAFVDQERPRQSLQQFFFEGIGHSLAGILADSETDRTCIFGGVQSGSNIRLAIHDAESFRRP